MSLTSEFSRGLSSYGRAHTVIFKYNLTQYLLIPGIISLGYGFAYILGVYYFSDFFIVGPDSLPDWLSWLGSAANWLVQALYWLFFIWAFFATFRYVIQVLLSPMLSKLSEEVEHRVWGGEPAKTGLKEAISDILRAFQLAIRNLIREVLYCFALSFIPVIGSVGAFFVSSYYMGFGFMDFTLERKRMNTSKSAAFARQHRGLTTGIGLVANVLMLIPVLGWAILPSYATVAATLEMIPLTNPEGHKTPPAPFAGR